MGPGLKVYESVSNYQSTCQLKLVGLTVGGSVECLFRIAGKARPFTVQSCFQEHHSLPYRHCRDDRRSLEAGDFTQVSYDNWSGSIGFSARAKPQH